MYCTSTLQGPVHFCDRLMCQKWPKEVAICYPPPPPNKCNPKISFLYKTAPSLRHKFNTQKNPSTFLLLHTNVSSWGCITRAVGICVWDYHSFVLEQGQQNSCFFLQMSRKSTTPLGSVPRDVQEPLEHHTVLKT